ncbi:7551_t:CDS:1, partial [Rhizophagus irregularis]
RPFSHNRHNLEETMKIKKIIPILLSQISLQERIDLDLKDIPTKTMFDYVLFIKQFDISLLYWLVCKKYTMAISKTIFMKTKRLDELTFLYEEYGDNHYESIFTLPKSQMLLNHITKL